MKIPVRHEMSHEQPCQGRMRVNVTQSTVEVSPFPPGSEAIIIINNYSAKWRWLVVDVYWATKRQGKYPPLATNTEVNSKLL